jgi:hypothetical protein
MTKHLRCGLQLTVDAAIALFQAARVPREVEMKQVVAPGLEVEALAGGVGGDEDPQRLRGIAGVTGLSALGGDRHEIILADDGDADAVLTACFRDGIPLLAFDRSEPTLRDVFLRLVGPDQAAEAVG